MAYKRKIVVRRWKNIERGEKAQGLEDKTISRAALYLHGADIIDIFNFLSMLLERI